LTENRPTRFIDLLVPGENLEPARADTPATHEPVSL
jgi:hypothetical protein